VHLVVERHLVHLELGPGRGPGRVVPLREHAAAAAVLAVALPHHDGTAVRVRGDGAGSVGLDAGRVRVHQELAAQGGAARVEALPIHVLVAADAQVHPNDHEVARGVRGDRRRHLRVRRVAVHAEVAALRNRARELPGLDPGARGAAPPPDEGRLPTGARRDSRLELRARRVGVDLELRSRRAAGGAERPREHAVGAAVLGVAVPDDDERAPGGRCNPGTPLDAGGVGVDLEGPPIRNMTLRAGRQRCRQDGEREDGSAHISLSEG
jgi:hypothetical protein